MCSASAAFSSALGRLGKLLLAGGQGLALGVGLGRVGFGQRPLDRLLGPLHRLGAGRAGGIVHLVGRLGRGLLGLFGPRGNLFWKILVLRNLGQFGGHLFFFLLGRGRLFLGGGGGLLLFAEDLLQFLAGLFQVARVGRALACGFSSFLVSSRALFRSLTTFSCWANASSFFCWNKSAAAFLDSSSACCKAGLAAAGVSGFWASSAASLRTSSCLATSFSASFSVSFDSSVACRTCALLLGKLANRLFDRLGARLLGGALNLLHLGQHGLKTRDYPLLAGGRIGVVGGAEQRLGAAELRVHLVDFQ